MPHNRWLVLMDTDRIKSYVFATNRLKEIHGASLLLNRLNTEESRALLANHDGVEVFIGGGGVLATFPDRARAEQYITKVQAAFRNETYTATITGVAIPIPTDAEGEQMALRQARAELHLAKRARVQSQALLTDPYFRLCESCNRYPASDVADGYEICAACASKRKAARLRANGSTSHEQVDFPAYSGYGKFARLASTREDGARWQKLDQLPNILERMEGTNQDTGHIGFIHADINNLGAFLEQLDNLARIGEVGSQIENALESALVDAVERAGLKPQGQTWPFLIIIMGGDDIVLIVPAKQAVTLANELCLAFNERIKALTVENVLEDRAGTQLETESKLALSAGVVISKPAHPVYALADLAEELVKSAKRRSQELSAEAHKPIPTLDVRVIHTPVAKPIETMRAQEYYQMRNAQEYWFTFWPLPCYPVGPWPGVSTLLENIRRLRDSNFPRNKLHDWVDLLNADEVEQIMRWQVLQTRLQGDAHQAMRQTVEEFQLTRERMFAQPGGIGQPFYTPLLDIVELYNFAGK